MLFGLRYITMVVNTTSDSPYNVYKTNRQPLFLQSEIYNMRTAPKFQR